MCRSRAADTARLGFPEVRIGFVPAIVSVFLARKLGEAALRELLLLGRRITAPEAARIGLIAQAVAPEALDAAVAETARTLAEEVSPAALRMTRTLLADIRGMGLREALGYAAQLNALARGAADCRAGVAAFLAKQPPPWKR